MDTDTNLKKVAITGAIWKFMERIGAQLISLVVSVVLARILMPEDYGVVAIVNTFFVFSDVLITAGLNTALIQKKNADEEDYSTVFTVSLVISVILYAILFLLAPVLAEIYRERSLLYILRVMGLSLPIYSIKSIACAYTSATLQFKKFFFATLGGTVFSAFVGIIMALKGFGAWALVAQQMSNSIIDTFILFYTTRLKVKFMISFGRLKSLLSYGWNILVSSVVTSIYSIITPIVMGIRFSSADLSFYTKGQSLNNTFSNSICVTLSSVLFPVLARYQDDKEKLLLGTRKFMQIVSYVVFPIMFGLFATADNFISVLLTDKWLPAAYYLRIFCIQGMADVIAIGNCETIKAMGRSDTYLKIETIKKLLYFVTLFLFVGFSKTPEMLAISVIFINIISISVNIVPNIKLIGYTLKMQVQDLLPNLISGIIMCVAVYFLGKLPINTFLALLIQISTGTIFYVILSLISKNKNFYFLLNLIKGKIKHV